jgi:EAL domain-containing protein (putative c-di-GMP-specific phosphodiesterase class I)/DNA-binding NarL/FixJ family response regulator
MAERSSAVEVAATDGWSDRKSSPVQRLSAANVMLVDEDPAVLGALQGALEQRGAATIQSHPNALSALTQIIGGERAVDLIFCDLRMPYMDGVEFFRRLAEIGYRGDLILVSGEDGRLLDMMMKFARVRKLNLLGCLGKPVNPEALEDLLENWSRPASVPEAAIPSPVSAAEIRQAIANRELINFYQLQVAVATGAVVGVESLVRWRRGRQEIVGPGRFIGVAESENLIEEITRYVVQRALLQSRVWRDQGLNLQLSINVTMDDLTQLDFPEFLAFEAARAGIPPSAVVLEVTERRLMVDPMAVFDVLTRLRLKGFRLSIDDFGTGYSSLAQLRDIAFDELKVDTSFVHGAAADPRLRAILQGSRSIAQQLGMMVVAEGIENQADWDLVQSARCDLAQGFFIAEPVPAYELVDEIADWHRRLPELFMNSILR